MNSTYFFILKECETLVENHFFKFKISSSNVFFKKFPWLSSKKNQVKIFPKQVWPHLLHQVVQTLNPKNHLNYLLMKMCVCVCVCMYVLERYSCSTMNRCSLGSVAKFLRNNMAPTTLFSPKNLALLPFVS